MLSNEMPELKGLIKTGLNPTGIAQVMEWIASRGALSPPPLLAIALAVISNIHEIDLIITVIANT